MRKIILPTILFLSIFCLTNKAFAATISVSSFITGDDVTITHLETMRSTFQSAINSADGALLQTATVPSSKLDANSNPENRWDEAFADFVYTGLLPPSTTSGLSSTTTAGTAYIYGVRVVKDATANTYTASKHTYVDLSKTGTYTYSEVEINASAPSVATNSIRLARVSTDTSKVLSVRDDRVVGVPLMAYADTRFKLGTFTRDISLASGTQEVTGVGFTPKTVIFFAAINAVCSSSGIDDGSTSYSITHTYANAAGTGGLYSIFASISATNEYYGEITTLGSDGFTITWAKEGTPTNTLTIYYLASK